MQKNSVEEHILLLINNFKGLNIKLVQKACLNGNQDQKRKGYNKE